MTIHKEGYASIILTIIFIVILNVICQFVFPDNDLILYLSIGFSIILFLIVLQFFRSPSFICPEDGNCILSPADGKVVVIEKVIEPEYFKAERIQVSIFMSPVNVHVNRYPIEGIVKYVKYYAGKYLVAWHPKSSTENERTSIVIQHPEGPEVLFRQIAGALARRIVYYCKEGDKARQGGEFGFIKFGSRVDLFLPLDVKINVKLDQKVKGGRTVIARLK